MKSRITFLSRSFFFKKEGPGSKQKQQHILPYPMSTCSEGTVTILLLTLPRPAIIGVFSVLKLINEKDRCSQNSELVFVLCRLAFFQINLFTELKSGGLIQ